MPLKITFLVRLSKVWFDIWYCLTDHQIVPGGSHGAPAHPECSPNVGAPTFPGCAVYPSSSSSSSMVVRFTLKAASKKKGLKKVVA